MRAVVVGGGLAGLVTAWSLARDGHEVELLESGGRLGGALASQVVCGLPLNAGAEGFAITTPVVFELLEELGLGDQVVSPRSGRSWIQNVRGAFPSPATSYLGIPANPLAPDVVAVIGQDAAHHAAGDAMMPPGLGYRPGISLGEYVTIRMGRAVRDLLCEPVVGGVHSTHPDLLELDSIAPTLHAAVLEHGSLQAAVGAIRGHSGQRRTAGAAIAGLLPTMDVLPQALTDQFLAAGGRLRLRAAATSVMPRYVQDVPTVPHHWDVALAGEVLETDAVVLATPVEVTRRLLAGVPPVAESIPSAPSSPIALATMVIDDERLDAAPRDNGVLVAAHTPGIVAKALTHVTAKWEHVRRAAEESAPGRHRHVLRLSYGRSGNLVPTRSELPDLALNDARRIMGLHFERESIVGFDQVRWNQTMVQARPGHQDALQEVAGRLASCPGLAITGAWLAGTGIAAVTSHARRVAAHLTGDNASHPITAEPVYRLASAQDATNNTEEY